MIVCKTATLRRRAVLVASNAVLALLVGSCSESDYGPYRPQAGGLSGAVRLIANLSDEAGVVTGTQTILDAQGVRVWLTRPDSSLDSTATSLGTFSFAAQSAGGYRAHCQPFPELTAAAPELNVAAGATASFDTLVLSPSGTVSTFPNPFPIAGLAIEFDVPTEQPAEVVAYSLAGQTAWYYAYDAPIGINHIHWIGIDNAGAELPDGWYWLVVRYGGTAHYNLVKKE